MSLQATLCPQANVCTGLAYLYKDLTKKMKQRVMNREINKFAHR